MKRKNKSLFITLALALACLMLLSACGGSSGGSSGAAPSEAASEPAAEATDAGGEDASSEAPSVAPGKKGTLEFWTVFTGADGTSMQTMVDAYNATDPDYTVNHRAMDANDLYLKLPLATQSQEDVPDIAINHVERLTLHSDNGYIDDFTPFLEGSPVQKENYNATLWEASDMSGGHYGVPLDSTAEIMFVNMDLYEKYGGGALDDEVVTWDEIEAVGDATVADGIIPLGISWRRASWLSGYGQLGGTMTQDGETPVLSDAPSIQVLETWQKLHDAGYTQKEGDAPWELFLGGQVLYVLEGSWMLNNAIESGVNYKIVDFPVYDTGAKGHWTSSHNFVLPRNDARDDEKTAAALDFINFIGENSMTWAEAGQIPAHLSVVEDPAFDEMPQAFIAQSDDSTLKVFTYKYYGFAVESLDKVLDEILYGRMSIEDGLAQAEQETKDRIEMEG